jgi:hypothetical protein
MKYSDITFSEKRYTLWTTRSAYHNVPQINGKEQKNGKEYKSKNTRCSTAPNNTVFSLDIKEAYENSNNINKWVRTFEYDKAEQVIKVTEDFDFDQCYEYRLNFLTPQTITIIGNLIELTADNGEKLTMHPDRKFDTEIEKILIDDERLKADWGTVLYRLSLKAKSKNDIINITFE